MAADGGGASGARPIRGLIEGFYGPPWSFDERAEVMARCAGWGMTHYVYAPKDDPLHRERWRSLCRPQWPLQPLRRPIKQCRPTRR